MEGADLLQEVDKIVQHQQCRFTQRTVLGLPFDVILHLFGICRKAPAVAFHNVSGNRLVSQVDEPLVYLGSGQACIIHAGGQGLKIRLTFLVVGTPYCQAVSLQQVKECRRNGPDTQGHIVIELRDLIIHTGLRLGQPLRHRAGFAEIHACIGAAQRACLFQIRFPINVECAENERTQRIGGLFFSACTDVFGLAVKIDIGFTAHPVPHPILCEFACVSQRLAKRVLLSYTKS